MSISTTLPVDTQNRRFAGVQGKMAAGTQVGSTDYAVAHVLLVDASNNPLVTSGSLNVQGPAAHDAAASGNPVQMGGVAESTTPSAVADGDAVRAFFDLLGQLAVVLKGSTGAAMLPDPAALADNTTNPTVTKIAAYLMGFDGTDWDRMRGTSANGLAVDVTRVQAGASTIGKAEDVASADADVGVPAMAVRKATPANTSGNDGDYEMLQMSAGRLWTSTVLTDSVALIGKTIAAETTATATVASGQQISGAVQTLSYRYFGLVVPSTFDGSQIAFTVSADNVTYQALNDINGVQVSMTVAASLSYDLPGELTAWPYFKIVTGTAQATTGTDFVVVMRS